MSLQRRHAAGSNSPYVFSGYGDDGGPRGHATKGIGKAMQRADINAEHKVKQLRQGDGSQLAGHVRQPASSEWLGC